MDEIRQGELMAQYSRQVRKKAKTKPFSQATLMMRANGTAIAVLEFIDGMSFRDLSSNLYFIAQDLKSEEFTRKYEAQIEYAAVKPQEFVNGIYAFFNSIAKHVKANDLYPTFFEFLSFLSRYLVEINDDKSIQGRIVNAYQALLMETLEFLRPNKFDLRNVVVGQAFDGTLLMKPDSHPLCDVPIRDLEDYLKTHPFDIDTFNSHVSRYFKAHGLNDVECMEDIDRITQEDRAQTHQISMLAMFTNEFTFDILPDPKKNVGRGLQGFPTLKTSSVDVEELKAVLMRRSRTLPANGMVYDLHYGDENIQNDGRFIQHVLLRENLHGDHMVVLYKAYSDVFETSGYYDTKDGFFYTVLREATDKGPSCEFEKLILTLYAAAVTRDGTSLSASLPEHFEVFLERGKQHIPISAEPFLRGGKLRRTDGQESEADHKRDFDNDNYETKAKAIQGFTRKVGIGKTPSAEAVARAKALGFELASDETYVQPFIKQIHYKKNNSNK